MSLRDIFDKLFQATPSLDDAETVRFLELIEEGLKRPTGPRPTPGLSEARRIALSRTGCRRPHPDDFPKPRLDMGIRHEPIPIGLCD
jgi:hypothetical protein